MNDALNDPTRSGPPLSVAPGKTLHLSRNEIESLCTKAARGAGMAWGLAEEAGYAAGWLTSRGLDGAGLLAGQLRSAQGKSWQEICPVVVPGNWCSTQTGQPLCPIALGATLSDHLGADPQLFDGHGLRVGEVTSPGLVLPFVAMAAGVLGKALCVQLDQAVVRVDAVGSLGGNLPALLAADCGALHIAVSDAEEPESVPAACFTALESDALTFLHELSMRTTVPASAASRASAGATGSDND